MSTALHCLWSKSPHPLVSIILCSGPFWLLPMPSPSVFQHGAFLSNFWPFSPMKMVEVEDTKGLNPRSLFSSGFTVPRSYAWGCFPPSSNFDLSSHDFFLVPLPLIILRICFLETISLALSTLLLFSSWSSAICSFQVWFIFFWGSIFLWSLCSWVWSQTCSIPPGSASSALRLLKSHHTSFHLFFTRSILGFRFPDLLNTALNPCSTVMLHLLLEPTLP